MERRFVTLSPEDMGIETREDGGAVVSGYAAVYYRADDPGSEFPLWNGAVERIMPGAFDRALAEADDVRALFNHDPNHVLGRTASGTLRLSTNRRGLRYEIDLPDTTLGRDLAHSIQRGDINGSSFAFQIDDESWRSQDGTEVREINAVRLFDVGPVTYPAYASTTSGMRAEDLAEVRSSHEQWKRDQEADAKAKAEAEEAKQQEITAKLDLLNKEVELERLR